MCVFQIVNVQLSTNVVLVQFTAAQQILHAVLVLISVVYPHQYVAEKLVVSGGQYVTLFILNVQKPPFPGIDSGIDNLLTPLKNPSSGTGNVRTFRTSRIRIWIPTGLGIPGVALICGCCFVCLKDKKEDPVQETEMSSPK